MTTSEIILLIVICIEFAFIIKQAGQIHKCIENNDKLIELLKQSNPKIEEK